MKSWKSKLLKLFNKSDDGLSDGVILAILLMAAVLVAIIFYVSSQGAVATMQEGINNSNAALVTELK